MKTLAVLLSLAITLPASAAPSAKPAVESSTAEVSGAEPLTVTAPREKLAPSEERVLKTARLTGGAAAGLGAGLMTYVVFFGAAGPFGWAAALIFVGGMTAYLSHRRLRGAQDFTPTGGSPAVPASSTTTARTPQPAG